MAQAVSPREKSLALVGRLVNALDDKKAADIRIIDVSAQSGVTDFFVIATGTADQHLRSMRMELERVLDEDKVKVIGIESQNDSGWTVIDAFDVIVHLFRADQRANYKFELLWKDGKEISAKQFIKATTRALPEQAVLISGNSKAPAEKAKKPSTAPAPKKPAVEKIVVKKAVVRKTAAVKAKPEYAQQAAKTNAMRKKADEKAAAQKAAAKIQKPLKPEKKAVVKKLVSAKAAKIEKAARGMAKAKVKTIAKAKVPAKSAPAAKAGVITRKAKRA